MARKLRIAVSVFFGVLTLALCVLWVRSYKTQFVAGCKPGPIWVISAGSNYGYLWITREKIPSRSRHGWLFGRWPASPEFMTFPRRVFWIPYWSLAICGNAAVVAPWTRLRFSLRTMLIATTLMAAVLGLVVMIGQ